MTVENVTRAQPLVTLGQVANTFFLRFYGLMGWRRMNAGEGLLISPCNSIHTFFMHFSIDVLYLDREYRVVGIDEALPPWRLGRFYRRVRHVLEIPAGAAQASGTQVGDQLEIHIA